MKKYFMRGTEDELQFGDMIELDFTRDTKGGVVHHHIECKFLPELIPTLLEDEAIEEREIEEEEADTPDPEDCPILEELLRANEALELKVENLESAIDTLRALVKKIVA